ncbi:hypothetical protein [uncultured Croceitalea sp.]|uniref:hypothetical protein n=1 Tax=uncultured Croceitalea sp. TaxID=1798908 RepID=UPI0033064EC1
MARTDIRIEQFTKEDFRKVKEILKEWNYDWVEYDLIESSDSENVDVTFFIDNDAISIGEFAHLMFCVGSESVFKQ